MYRLTCAAAVCLTFVVGAVGSAGAQTLRVSVGKTRILMRGANYPALFKSADGSIILAAATGGKKQGCVISSDGGDTWKDWPGSLPVGADGSHCLLPDGTALAFGFHTNPVKDQADRYEGQMWSSGDNWKTIEGPAPTYVDMPHVTEGHGDGGPSERLVGPMFHGRTRVLTDGSLLATYYTNFVADTKIKTSSPYRFRCTLARSTDRGKTWKYLSSIASLEDIADPKLLNKWQDGFDEPSLEVLPDGRLVCAMRVGTYAGEKAVETYEDLSLTVVRKGKHYVSNGECTRPIYLATSTDGGATWSKPRPVPGAWGACPRLLSLSSGVLALSCGRLFRPTQGDAVVFSADGGETWTNSTIVFPGLSSGYTDMVAVGPGKLLYVFDSVTAWGPKYTPDWIGAVDIEVKTE